MTRQLFSVVLIGVFAALLAGCGRQAEVVEAQAQPGVVSAMGQTLALFVASDSLGLTPEQKQLIEAAMKKHQAAVQALMGQLRSGAITRDDFQSKLAALEQQLEEELKSILTPEQYEKWKQHQDNLRQNGGVPYPLFAPLEHLARLLSLSPEQVQKATRIVEQAQNDLKTAFQTITDRDQLRKTVEEILKRADEQFRNILTPEQAAKYDQLKHTKPAQPQIPYPLFAPLDHLARALGLTPDQIEKAKAIVEQAQKDLKTAFQTITDKDQLRKAVEEILKRTDQDFQGILTPEQAIVYDRLKQGRKGGG